MRFLLKPGAEADVVSPEELRALLVELADRFAQTDETYVNSAQVATNAGGNGADVVAQVEPGYELRVMSVTVDVPGTFTVGAPYTNAAASLMLRIDDPAQGGLVDVGGPGAIIPSRFSWTSDAPVLRSGQKLFLVVGTGPASTVIVTRTQGILQRVRNPVPRLTR